MLIELSIKHFAIIEELTIPFEKGLTVLTGETGAGKSIIIDAIGLIVGGRGSAEYVRHGEKRAEIEGLFIVEETHPVLKKAEELGINVSDAMLILRREITAQGKSICRVNGKLVTIAILREIGQSLVDIHGQHEHQVLMQHEHHLSMLDGFADQQLRKTLNEYQALYERSRRLYEQVQNLNKDEQEMAQKIDLLKYQLSEIEQTDLMPNEDDQLIAERHKLAHSEKLYSLLESSYESLYGDHSSLEYLTTTVSNLEEAATIDEELTETSESVKNSFYLLEEASFAIRQRMDQIDFNPERLHFIEGRLHEISQLKRKYGTSVNEILEYAAKTEEELETIVHKDDHLLKLQAQLDSLWKDMLIEAEALTTIRKQTAQLLTEAIHEQLRFLYMEKAKFEVSFGESTSSKYVGTIDGQAIPFKENGIDTVEFFMSTNIGEPMKPLAKVASGGEISRMMLALKSIFSNQQEITAVIFDEIDTGVGGRVAQAIAEKIHRISNGSQVLCISHLPQVAAMADTHLFIAKQEIEERVATTVTELTFEEKVTEVARMISGVEVTELTKKHARELLELAKKFKTTSNK